MSTLYQFNTLGSIMTGLYDGNLSLSNLLRHGSFGIGTFDQLDGEMVVLDGVVYQCLEDNSVKVAAVRQRIPYAAVTYPEATANYSFDSELDSEKLYQFLEEKLVSKNLFHSIRIEGKFSQMHIRMAPKTPSGTSFDEVAAHQPEYRQKDIQGTIVGFWTPGLFNGMSVAGFHLHFISDDRKFGGHVMDFKSQKIKAELGRIERVEQEFPVNDENFLSSNFDVKKISKILEIAE